MWLKLITGHRHALILIALAGLGFMFGLGVPPLFDWDEINFAESAREMIASGNYFRVQINYQPFWEKPPLFFWLQAACMHVFGVGEFAARLPNALVGMATLAALYLHGSQWKNAAFGLLLSAVYVGNVLPSLYFKTGIIDPTFNFFIFAGLMEILRFELGKPGSPVLAGVWIGIATLTKGPVALLVTVAIFGLYRLLFRRQIPWRQGGLFVGTWAAMVLGWYGIETLLHGPQLVQEFIKYQIELFTQPVASHGQPWYYHMVVFVVACFPMSAFVFRSMVTPSADAGERVVRRFMTLWWWVIMVLFSVSTTKIVHYTSLLYFPGAVLMALLLSEHRRLRWDTWLLLVPGLVVWGVLPACINMISKQLPAIEGFVKDPLARAMMQQPAHWSGWEWLGGAVFLLGSGYALVVLRRGQVQRYAVVQAATTLLSLNLLFVLLGPRIGEYTYQPAVGLFSEISSQKTYVFSYGYKSYLPYFYGRVQPGGDPRRHDHDWLRQGSGLDRDVYLVIHRHRIADEDFRQHYALFEHVKDSGAYALFVRRATATPAGEDMR